MNLFVKLSSQHPYWQERARRGENKSPREKASEKPAWMNLLPGSSPVARPAEAEAEATTQILANNASFRSLLNPGQFLEPDERAQKGALAARGNAPYDLYEFTGPPTRDMSQGPQRTGYVESIMEKMPDWFRRAAGQ